LLHVDYWRVVHGNEFSNHNASDPDLHFRCDVRPRSTEVGLEAGALEMSPAHRRSQETLSSALGKADGLKVVGDCPGSGGPPAAQAADSLDPHPEPQALPEHSLQSSRDRHILEVDGTVDSPPGMSPIHSGRHGSAKSKMAECKCRQKVPNSQRTESAVNLWMRW